MLYVYYNKVVCVFIVDSYKKKQSLIVNVSFSKVRDTNMAAFAIPLTDSVEESHLEAEVMPSELTTIIGSEVITENQYDIIKDYAPPTLAEGSGKEHFWSPGANLSGAFFAWQ